MIRRALVASVLAVAAFLAVPGSPAYARPCALGSYCYLDYYADSTYSVLVGSTYTGCDGSSSSWGVTTIYKDFLEIPC